MSLSIQFSIFISSTFGVHKNIKTEGQVLGKKN